MSYTFPRRAFLKYSATTAVAMAGAGLLGGCEFKDPNNPVSKELPSTLTSRLQVIASLNTMKIADNTCTLEVEIQSARVNPIRLTTDSFSVAVKDAAGKQRYLSLTNGGVQIKSAENLLLQKKKSTKVQLAAIGFPEKLEEVLFPPSYLLPGLPIRRKIYMMKIAHSIKCFNKQLLKKTGAA